jgi:hypothetical protein
MLKILEILVDIGGWWACPDKSPGLVGPKNDCPGRLRPFSVVTSKNDVAKCETSFLGVFTPNAFVGSGISKNVSGDLPNTPGIVVDRLGRAKIFEKFFKL